MSECVLIWWNVVVAAKWSNYLVLFAGVKMQVSLLPHNSLVHTSFDLQWLLHTNMVQTWQSMNDNDDNGRPMALILTHDNDSDNLFVPTKIETDSYQWMMMNFENWWWWFIIVGDAVLNLKWLNWTWNYVWNLKLCLKSWQCFIMILIQW